MFGFFTKKTKPSDDNTQESLGTKSIETNYITPNLSQHNTLQELLQSSPNESRYWFLPDSQMFSFDQFYTLSKGFILGEPGYGKTRLFKEILLKACENNKEAIFIDLKTVDSDIETFIFQKSLQAKETKDISSEKDLNNSNFLRTNNFTLKNDESITVCLDALDEVKKEKFSSVIEWIKKFSEQYNNVSVLISCRRHHFTKYQDLFSHSGFKYIQLWMFSQQQTSDYLTKKGMVPSDIEAITNNLEFGSRQLIIQVPRYLSMLTEIFQKKGLEYLKNLNRADLFEYFIYEKIGMDDKTNLQLIKRVLEKMALTMEMYQTNTLSKDEMFTFFDDIKSNLATDLLHQTSLELFYERSLLKDNIDYIEFENTEFQEYLAAKEIARMGRVEQIFFELAVDKELLEIYPTWFSTIQFLLLMEPSILRPLIDFGASRTNRLVQDEEYHQLLTKCNPSKITLEDKQQIFKQVFQYYQDVLHWLPLEIAENLVDYYGNTVSDLLKTSADEIKEKGLTRDIRHANVAYVVGYIQEKGLFSEPDARYWKEKLLEFASESNRHMVFQRHCLFALSQYGDISLIQNIKGYLDLDEDSVEHALMRACTEIDPNNVFSLECFVEGVKNHDMYAFLGINEIKRHDAIEYLVDLFIRDNQFLHKFIDRESIYFKGELTQNISKVINEPIKEKLKQLIQSAFSLEKTWYEAGSSGFIKQVALLLKETNKGYIFELLTEIKKSQRLTENLWAIKDIFAVLLDVEQVDSFITEFKTLPGEEIMGLRVLQTIYFSDRVEAAAIYEAGRKFYKEEYRVFEEHTQKNPEKQNEDEKLYSKFKFKLQPEPGQFISDVFRFYLDNKVRFVHLMLPEDTERLMNLVTGSVFDVYDPGKQELHIDKRDGGSTSYTTDRYISVFGDCIVLASELGMDVSKYRDKIINYIPFAYSNHQQAIFKLINNITPAEVAGLISIYTENRKDDLAVFMPDSLIEASQRYGIVETVPVLKRFIEEKQFDMHIKLRTMEAISQLLPDKDYFKALFDSFSIDPGKETYKIAEKANEVLIDRYLSDTAIKWRFEQLISRAFAFKEPKGAHWVGGEENELHEKEFAGPLLRLKDPKYIDSYLTLLKESFDILAKGDDYWSYAKYLWDIVKKYFYNLKEYRSYSYLKRLEDFIKIHLKSAQGINWFKYSLKDLTREYMNFLGKPITYSECIKQYNLLKERQSVNISSSTDLIETIKTVINEDLKNWIVFEGAYQFVNSASQHQEDLIQKTVKTQLEIGLLKRGLRQCDIRREEQLLDDKRIDFLISYGFLGPVLIEIKRVDNREIVNDTERTEYKDKLIQYIKGSKSVYGLFLIFQINNNKSLDDYIPKVVGLYKECNNIEVVGFDCLKHSGISKTKTYKKRKIKKHL